jgi:hypothetical protein
MKHLIAFSLVAFVCACPPPAGGAASDVFSAVNVTSLAGASAASGTAGEFQSGAIPSGTGAAPALSNTVASAVPGTPAKPIFISQSAAFDTVIVSVEGHDGFFALGAAGNKVLGLDLVAATSAKAGSFTVDIATQTGGATSSSAKLTLVVDPHQFVAAGDLENHDTAATNVADLFGAFLEGLQSNQPKQITSGHNNNADIINGVKGPDGPQSTGHREVVWDGVPEAKRNNGNFPAAFFDRQDNGQAGVRGGIVFTHNGGTGIEVNDALNGSTPDPSTVGPPNNPNAKHGGDFSNINPSYAGNLLSFTQPVAFAPLGTVQTDVTFHVAGSQTKAVVSGFGVVFISVDVDNTSSLEFFDESDASIAKVIVPTQSHGPFPFPGPVDAANIPFSFAGYVDHTARIARVRITNGQKPVDTAAKDENGSDVVTIDDIYYSEPKP